MFQVAMVRLIAGHYRRSGDDLAGTSRPGDLAMQMDGDESSNIEDRRSEGGGFGGGGGGFGGGGFPHPDGRRRRRPVQGRLRPDRLRRHRHDHGRRSAAPSWAACGRRRRHLELRAGATVLFGQPHARHARAGRRRRDPVRLARAEEHRGRLARASSSDMGRQYREPRLVLFRDATRTAVRRRPGGDGAVLLPGRPAGLSRPRLLRRAGARASARPASSRRPT